ncbi:hypothetical protein ERO13_A12G249050v2 [Gossypium hirsutum]|uniref:Uncharacterized protein n=2 Tax=Gossypium TaxID=3633 RepID=A0A5J5TF75_GOSBA|nr:hypothetical protein ES319_A12G260400v1 [Gossypium barbadense]KAG4172052.1 hypothetical protein ERO13_A12G249050v2 [Gossypium hirsutum]TYJ06953.1 hypothetical protein E1A91_A12G270700v1 [Gossypium mustelinum]
MLQVLLHGNLKTTASNKDTTVRSDIWGDLADQGVFLN